MKKLSKTTLFLPILLTIFGCSSTPDTIATSDIWDEKYSDSQNNINLDTIKTAKIFKNGEYVETVDAEFDKDSDYKYEFYTDEKLRYVDLAAGYSLTLPVSEDLKINTRLAKNYVSFERNYSKLRVSMEDPKPYTTDLKGYTTFIDEWLWPYLRKENFYTENNFVKFKDELVEDTTLVTDYAVTSYYFEIKDPGTIDMPFYHIALMRKKKVYSRFAVILYKSNAASVDEFEQILKSFSIISSSCTQKNYFEVQDKIINEGWSRETKKFFNSFSQKEKPYFGFFNASMDNTGTEDYNSIKNQILHMDSEMETEFETTFEIMPTYTHLRWHNLEHNFPSMPFEIAGGNGFNGKKVLQFTYQFTTNNNNVSRDNESDLNATLIDVLRGIYDEKLHKLGQDIKSYEQPVLFRLNNEMNTDWTSYCGLLNLLDPELFIDSWIHLYEIFEEEQVDNCMWIWNPFDTNSPTCNWGDALSYYPGNEYVQLLGLTSYEFNNSAGGDSGVAIKTFKTRFTDLYDKYNPYFSNMPYIISEFACAAGGEASGVLGRNEKFQANWVEDMFTNLSLKKDFCSNIKGIVWFNCNDVNSSGQIVNYLRIDKSLTLTREAFKNGFKKLNEM